MLQGITKEASARKAWKSMGKAQAGGGLGDLLGQVSPAMGQQEAAKTVAKNLGIGNVVGDPKAIKMMPTIVTDTKSKPKFMRGALELAKKHKRALLGAAIVTSIPASLLAYKKFREK